MKAIKLLIAVVSIGLAASSCNQNDCEQGDLTANCNCYEIYAPVCGCDGVTYANDCHAECAGISDYSEGTCN